VRQHALLIAPAAKTYGAGLLDRAQTAAEDAIERTEALETFLHQYNYHRCHTGIGGQTPISRINVNNVHGHYN
jgi:hypothetical protein